MSSQFEYLLFYIHFLTIIIYEKEVLVKEYFHINLEKSVDKQGIICYYYLRMDP